MNDPLRIVGVLGLLLHTTYQEYVDFVIPISSLSDMVGGGGGGGHSPSPFMIKYLIICKVK